MRISIFGVLAEITMQAIEKEIFQRATMHIKLWKRFVDDVISIVPKSSLENTLDLINSINPHIQFEMETERDNTLAFLDL